MKRILLVIVLFCVSDLVHAQFRNEESVVYEKELKTAETLYCVGVGTTGVSLLTILWGGLVCSSIEQDYIDAHVVEGTKAEIRLLGEEAKELKRYKNWRAVEVSGLIGLAFGVFALYNSNEIKHEIKNSSGSTVAIISYGCAGPSVAVLRISF